jgi:hypothetical protein
MTTLVLSGLLVAVGATILIRTVAAGVGGGLGLLIGILFVVAGGLRLYLQRTQTRG